MSTVLFEGVLQKKGKVNRAWKTRYCKLTKRNDGNVFLQYYGKKMSNTLLGTISISEVYAVEVISDYDLKINELPQSILINSTTRSDKKYSFLIDTKRRKYVFAGIDTESFITWLHMLHKYTYGCIIKHGWLNKKGNKNKQWKQRYFVLSKGNIKYYEDFEQTKYLGTIHLNQVSSMNEGIVHNDHQKYKYIFRLKTAKRIWILCAESDKERESWIQQIQNTFKRTNRRRKTTDLALDLQAAILEKTLVKKKRKSKLRTYQNCFVGCDAVEEILDLDLAANEAEAVKLGQKLIKNGIIRQVENQQTFENKKAFYQFTTRFHKKMIDNMEKQESIPLQLKAEMLEKRLEIKTRKWKLKSYLDCFVGSQATKLIIKLRLAGNEEEAVRFGNRLMECGLLVNVANTHTFKNKNKLFYRFTPKFYKAKTIETAATLEAHQHLLSMDKVSDSTESAEDSDGTGSKRSSLFGSLVSKILISVSHSDKEDDVFAFSCANLEDADTLISLDRSATVNNPLDDNDEKVEESDDDSIQTTKTVEFCNKCDSLESCESLNRIIAILEFYKDNFNDEEKVNAQVQKYRYLLNDYHHILDKHLY